MTTTIDPALIQDLARLQSALSPVISGLTRAAGATNNVANSLAQQGTRVSGSLASVGVGMNRLRSDIDRGRVGYREAAQSLRYLQQQFDDMDDTVRRSAAGDSIATQQKLMSAQLFRRGMAEVVTDFGKTLLGGVLSYYKNQVTTNIKGIQDNVGGLQASFNLQNQALRDQIDTLNKLSNSALAGAAALTLINPVAGAVAGGVGVFLKALAESNDVRQQAITIFQTEIAKSSESFKIITSAGATFADDILGMRTSSVQAGLDLKDFAVMVSQNSDSLAALGGTVGAGVKRFTDVNKQLDKHRLGLLNLGYTTEEQAQATIDYMNLMRATGALERMSAEELAKGTSDYLTNLRAVSAFTGEDAKKAQARAKEASDQLAVRSKLMEKGPEALAAFESSIRNMDPIMQKAMQQAVAFDGTIIDKNLSQLFAMSPARKELFDRTFRDYAAGLSPEELTNNYQRNLKELGSKMSQEGARFGSSLGALNLATGGMADLTKMVEDSITLGMKGQQALTDSVNPTADAMKELKDKTEGLVPEISKATEAFINSRRTFTEGMNPFLPKFASGNLSPIARKSFAEQIKDAEELTANVLRQFGVVIDGYGKMVEKITNPSPTINPQNLSKEDAAKQIFAPHGVGNALDLNPKIKEELEKRKKDSENKDSDKTSWSSFFSQSQQTAMHVIIDGDNRQNKTASIGNGMGDSQTPVLLSSDTSTQNFANKFSEAFSMAMATINARSQQNGVDRKVAIDDVQLAGVLAKSFEVALSQPNEISRGLDALKTQMADASREQLVALYEQKEKLGSVEVAMRDNIRVGEDIKKTLA